ncbi:50S ribosomal protein L29 [Candidatus Peregrinibacteria bacterium]|nr:50S ribosomal protein L29 [Candidatus Peregrinibacteria bacterium]
MLSIQELRSSTKKELLEELKNARAEMLKVRITCKTKSMKDSSQANKQRKYIAQINTVIRELELEEKIKEAIDIEK